MIERKTHKETRQVDVPDLYEVWESDYFLYFIRHDTNSDPRAIASQPSVYADITIDKITKQVAKSRWF